MKNEDNRAISFDITRITACVFVIIVHFFWNTNYYLSNIDSSIMYISTLVRTICITCVPLFMLLSGALLHRKNVKIEIVDLGYFYLRLVHIVLTYFLCTGCIFIYRMGINKEVLGWKDYFGNILRYDQYSWYVGMYICFYLLVPFLNILWNVLDKNSSRTLVAVLIILTALPSFLNIYDFSSVDSFICPWLHYESFTVIVPNSFVSIYPITYYYLGAYIDRYVDIKKLDRFKVFFLLTLSILFCTFFNIWKSYTIPFQWGIWQDFGGWQNVLNSVLIFVFTNLFDYSFFIKVKDVITFISKLTFGAYLISWIPDDYYYKTLNSLYENYIEKASKAYIYIPRNIILSFLLAGVIYLLKELMCRIFKCVSKGIQISSRR